VIRKEKMWIQQVTVTPGWVEWSRSGARQKKVHVRVAYKGDPYKQKSVLLAVEGRKNRVQISSVEANLGGLSARGGRTSAELTERIY
jgi:hypothetical protein